MSELLPIVVALPLLGAVVAAALPSRSQAWGLAAALATTGVALTLTFRVAATGPVRADIGGWGPPLGIALQADGLSAALLAMANLVALAASVYATDYFRRETLRRRFWPLWLLLWSALNGLFVAADLFNLYVTLELLGLSAAALTGLGGERAAVAAGLRYLLVGLLGSMTYLLGVALFYTAYGTLDLRTAAGALTAGPVAWTLLTLLTAGLALKAALFPLHFWLPPAHANAPAPVSAALSALVVKAAYYLVLRLWVDLFAPVASPAAANLLGVLGAAAVLWGSWRAFRAQRLKLLAAYSTVAQIGYLFLFFPLAAVLPAGAARAELLGAVMLLALTHGFAKAGLFLAAGQVQHHAGHDRIEDLQGTAETLPVTIFTIALAGVALIGLPPSGAFLAKWLLLSKAFAAGQWWWTAAIMGGTLLAGAYMFRLLSKTFSRNPGDVRAAPMARADLPALLLVLAASAGLGLAGQPLWRLLGAGGGP